MKNIDTKYIEHALYLNKETIKEKRSIKDKLGIETYRLEELWDYKDLLCGFDSLIAQPQYFNKDMVELINEKYIKCLYLEDRRIRGFFAKEPDKYKTLTNLSFLENISHLKCFKMDAHTPFFSEKPILKIEDYTPLENLTELEYIYIPDHGEFPVSVDIDFSKLPMLKDVSLQYPKENRTIYKCQNIEDIDTRYYEKDLTMMKNWKKLKYFSAYCDNLESFAGLDIFNELEISKVEITSKFKTFEECNSESIKIFYIYTEAKTLKGLSGLTRVENIAINGLKQLESIDNLQQCGNLKELTFENCKIPDDIFMLNKLLNLEKLVFDDCKDIESLQFVRELPNLKYLSFDGNTKVIDGNLDFLKELADTGVEIYFNNRKHYSIKYEDLDS